MNQVLQDFNDVTDAIENMKDKLSDCQDQIQKMMDKASDCSSSLTKLQAEQLVLRAKMIALGVDATKISKTGHVVYGVHFTQKIPTVAAKPQQSAVPFSSPKELSSLQNRVQELSNLSTLRNLHYLQFQNPNKVQQFRLHQLHQLHPFQLHQLQHRPQDPQILKH